MKKLSFSKSFLFGASTAAHQVEGGNFNNDWWEFEQKGKIRDGSSSRVACDHYRLFERDFALAEKLGHNSHRLSLEWSRLEPKPGVFSKKETAHYRRVLKSLKKHRLTSFVTLQHFTMPLWFAEAGGWANPDSPRVFKKYARYGAQNFGDLVDFWLTINEPQALVMEGYLRGRFPPEKKNPVLAVRAARHLMEAHRRGYQAIHQEVKPARVSFTTVHNYFEPNALIAFPDWFLKQAKNHLDYIGLDYYHHYRLGLNGLREYPQEKGLLPLLERLNRFGLPIYITENGTMAGDRERERLIRENLKAVLAAIQKGVDVRGYLHWTLMDNFEWFRGLSCRMGLCRTDFKTQKRAPRRSAFEFRRIIRERKA